MPDDHRSPPSAPALAAPPDYAAQYGAATDAYLRAYPQLYGESARSHLGTGEFAGLGDQELAANSAQAQVGASRILAPATLDLMKQYGPEYIAQEKAMAEQQDPEKFALRKQLFDQSSQDVGLQGQLNPVEDRMMNENIRGGQFARGGFLDGTSTAEEVVAKYNLQQQKKQQSFSNAMSLMTGTQAPGVNNPVPYQTAQPGQTVGVEGNPGAAGPSYAANIYGAENSAKLGQYGIESQNWATQANQPDAFSNVLGMMLGAGSKIGAAAI